MQHYWNEIEHILGLSLRLKFWLSIQVTGLSVGLLLHSLDAQVDTYIWHPSLTYYLMVLLLFSDFCTGVLHAWRRNAFETRKALRSVWKLVSYTFLLGIAHNLGRSERLFAWLPEAVLVPMILFLLLSVLKNMSLLGWIEPRLASLLYRKIDTYKNAATTETPNAHEATH